MARRSELRSKTTHVLLATLPLTPRGARARSSPDVEDAGARQAGERAADAVGVSACSRDGGMLRKQ
eukprot:1774816-Alexandrium_andersonii.AAC.1